MLLNGDGKSGIVTYDESMVEKYILYELRHEHEKQHLSIKWQTMFLRLE
jgi:hypothetical protein